MVFNQFILRRSPFGKKNALSVNKNIINSRVMVLAVTGISDGVGRRHFTVMLANYLRNCLGKKTAVIFVGEYFLKEQTVNFQDRKENDDCKNQERSKSDKKPFRICGVDFYENISSDIVTELINEHYECLIISSKWDNIQGREEFFRSDIKIVVGSLSKWRITEYKDFIREYEGSIKGRRCICVSLTGDEEYTKYIKRKHNIQIHKIPFEENPFYMKSDIIMWFYSLFGLI